MGLAADDPVDRLLAVAWQPADQLVRSHLRHDDPFTLSAGPAQALFAWKLAHPSIRRHKRWFILFLVSSLLFYTELKNVMVRTAHIKELMGERTWKVTPRATRPASAGPPDGTERRDPSSVGAPLRDDTVPVTLTGGSQFAATSLLPSRPAGKRANGDDS